MRYTKEHNLSVFLSLSSSFHLLFFPLFFHPSLFLTLCQLLTHTFTLRLTHRHTHTHTPTHTHTQTRRWTWLLHTPPDPTRPDACEGLPDPGAMLRGSNILHG